MLLHCPSRKCNTTREQLLNVDTDEVICSECNQINPTISDYMKATMKGSGHIYRTVQPKKAFMYACNKCVAHREVILQDEQAVCKMCKNPIQVPSATLTAIAATAHLRDRDDDVSSEPEVDEDGKKVPVERMNKGVVKRRS